MFSNRGYFRIKRRGVHNWLASLSIVLAALACSCSVPERPGRFATLAYTDGRADLFTLAFRFAPHLFLHADEPYSITAVFPVFHPERPLIAYHVFFEHDAIWLGGEDPDHEIVWVEYDPVTLKIADVVTLWHRTVLRTGDCLMDAKASDQRPTIFVQWGQHGLLPLGWESIKSTRPRLELPVHYNIVNSINRLPSIRSGKTPVSFGGTYADYITFTVPVDTRDFLERGKVIVALRPEKVMREFLPGSPAFKVKKEWPEW